MNRFLSYYTYRNYNVNGRLGELEVGLNLCKLKEDINHPEYIAVMIKLNFASPVESKFIIGID